jgi:hypothetical protein
VGAPLHGGSGVVPPKVFLGDFLYLFLAVFRHMVYVDVFLILVKELGLTNPGQWIRVLDSVRS